ncbi:hypothetical protein C6844_10965 [Neisseria gonorrhoeae]
MKAFEDKALAVSADMADALADGGAAATAVGCPPRLIGGGSKIKPQIRRVRKKQKTKNFNSSISVILYRTAKADL